MQCDHTHLEHGGAHPISLSEYYGDGGAPSSGAISLNDFRQDANSSGASAASPGRENGALPWSGSTRTATSRASWRPLR